MIKNWSVTSEFMFVFCLKPTYFDMIGHLGHFDIDERC